MTAAPITLEEAYSPSNSGPSILSENQVPDGQVWYLDQVYTVTTIQGDGMSSDSNLQLTAAVQPNEADELDSFSSFSRLNFNVGYQVSTTLGEIKDTSGNPGKVESVGMYVYPGQKITLGVNADGEADTGEVTIRADIRRVV